MKIILVSDLHMMGHTPVGRLDDAPTASLLKLEYILAWAKKHDGIVLVAGDFFDTPRNWFVMIGVLNLLKKYEEVDVYSVFGQHDTYMYSEKTRDFTALGALAKSNWVTILDSEPVQYDDFDLYGVHFRKNQIMPSVVNKNTYNILVIHTSISDAPAYPGHQYTKAEAFMKKNKDFDIILCGDIHRNFFIISDDQEQCVVNTGPVIRKDASEYNFSHEPMFYVINTDDDMAFSSQVIPHQPADDVLTRDHIDTQLNSKEMLQDFVDSVNADDSEDMGIDLIKNIFDFMKRNKIEKPVQNILTTLMSEKGMK
jgi:DNA repair exonuclease SbcCD nuclease subunit